MSAAFGSDWAAARCHQRTARWLAALAVVAVLPACGGQPERPFTIGAFLQPKPGAREQLERRAWAVSDPSSGSYGAYMSQQDLASAIGIGSDDVRSAARWIHDAASAIVASLPHSAKAGSNASSAADPVAAAQIALHGDAIALEVKSFETTYLLGAGLAGLALPGGRSPPLLPAAPSSLELLVTPMMPEGFCHRLTHLGQDMCVESVPCQWKTPKHKKKPRCMGDHAGWVCWATAGVWKCIEPNNLGANGTTASGQSKPIEVPHWRKRRRRGRARFLDSTVEERWSGGISVEEAESKVDALPESKAPKGPLFRVLPIGGGMALLVRLHSKNASWPSVELSFRQQGVHQSRIIRTEGFEKVRPGIGITKVGGVANLRPVDDMAVCILGNGSDAGAGRLSSNPCVCNETAGVDERNRTCQVLLGLSPRSGTVDFVLPDAPQSLSAVLRDLDMPEGVGALGVTGHHGRDGDGQVDDSFATQAVAEFNDERFLQEDVNLMHANYGLVPPVQNISIEGQHNMTGKTNFNSAGEGSLDLQVITALAPRAKTSWWSIEPEQMDGFMLAYTVKVNNHSSPPLVHSISWGDAEALFPPEYIQRLDYELMKLALRGITMLVASGDNGISSINTGCLFAPDMLGSSPWVTTVGATMTSLEAAPYCKAPKIKDEVGDCDERGPVTCSVVAGALITSSGYWSIYRPRPRYQDGVVEEYVRRAHCAPCLTNGAGPTNFTPTAPCQHVSDQDGCALGSMIQAHRGASDIAGPGHNYPVAVNGSVGLMDGTSASAPAIAALVTRLNEVQLRNGRPPLGLLNPWLYSVYVRHPEAFVDVVVGDVGSTEAERCPWGYRAAPGWDPATGLGVPRYRALLQHLPAVARNVSLAAKAIYPLDSVSTVADGSGSTWVRTSLLLGCVTAMAVATLSSRRCFRKASSILPAHEDARSDAIAWKTPSRIDGRRTPLLGRE